MRVKRDYKIAVCVVMSLMFLAATFFVNLPGKKESLAGLNTLTAIQYDTSSAAIVTTSENGTYLVLAGGSKKLLDGINTAADKYGIISFDAVIFCEISLRSASMFDEIYSLYTVNKAVLPYSPKMPPLDATYYVQIIGTGVTAVYTDDIDGLNMLNLGDISLRYLGDGLPLSLSIAFGGINAIFINNITPDELTYAFTYAPAEPSLILTSGNFDRVLMHYHNALVLFGNRMYNYFDNIVSSAQADNTTSPLTLKVSDGKITGIRV